MRQQNKIEKLRLRGIDTYRQNNGKGCILKFKIKISYFSGSETKYKC